MIPKIIHYCWFGNNPLPKLGRQCIQSWKKHCPDWEIKEWNEQNSPINLFPFAQEALKAQKYAFVSDVIRLYALYTEGGVYLDTDVELLKPLSPFLNHHAFTGYEKDSNALQTAIIGAEPNNIWIGEWMGKYKNLIFTPDRYTMSTLVNNRIITNMLLDNGIILDGCFKDLENVTIYPHEYFCPMSYGTHFIEKTESTICIHYYTFSWSEPETFKGYLKKYIVALIGEKKFRSIINCIRKMFFK